MISQFIRSPACSRVPHSCLPIFLLVCFGGLPGTAPASQPSAPNEPSRPNVVLIICDDLNDYVEGFAGHPQVITPNMARLAESGVRFTQAHCNIPICGPSRACLFSGIYPHHSGCYGFFRWDTYEVLKNSRTLMDYFRENHYSTLGTGKLMHHSVRQEWQGFGNRADYGPFAYDGKQNVPHPDTPVPYNENGPVDGSFGPLVSLAGRTDAAGNSLMWRTGGWAKVDELTIHPSGDNDPTPDEKNGTWAVEQLHQLAAAKGKKRQPFFMGVGFIRPHTPLIVPKRFFDMFPVETIALPKILDGDVGDTFARTIRSLPGGKEPESSRTEDMGSKLFRTLVESYGTRDEALRHFIQAYLASIASVDEQVGRILDAIENTGLRDNTIVILTSDHGWGMGEKDYLYKNSLWQESTRVPLIVRAPGVAQPNSTCDRPVSLIDIYPTLADLCDLQGETMKNERGHPLDGHSLKPLIKNPLDGEWSGPDEALTALYKWRMEYDPHQESYSLRSKDWRYIHYENGKEELYKTSTDPYEWTNLATDASHAGRLTVFREKLFARLPAKGTIPKQPAFQPDPSKNDADYWKDAYFKKHPDADANRDGTLSWPELKAHKNRGNSSLKDSG